MLSSFLFAIAVTALLFAQVGGSSSLQRHTRATKECRESCGHVKIAPPFGIRPDCYSREEFAVTCIESSSNTKLILTKFNLEVVDILDFDPANGQITINLPMVIRACADGNSTGKRLEEMRVSSLDLSGSSFFYGTSMFVSVGCQGLASIYNETGGKMGGCTSSCSPLTTANKEGKTQPTTNGCYGYRCCQSEVRYTGSATGFHRFNIGISPGSNKGSCTTAFIIGYDYFLTLNSTAVAAIARSPTTPVILGYWDQESLSMERNYAISRYVIIWCSIIIGTAIGTLLVSCGCFWACWYYKTRGARKEAKLRAKYFKGKLEQGSNNRDMVYKTKVFTIKELKVATDNFNIDRILGQGGQGTVYKGMLTNGQVIAVKRSRTFEEVHWKQFINEVILLSQLNHRNVVKLLGCCLEPKLPLLVYEFIPNGTLAQHIHNSTCEFVLTWDMRVRIASEAAGAVAYLHSSSTTPIYHRDIKSTNILLDDKFQAKVADFGISKAVSMDQTHLTTRVQGTIGYLDPEYFQSSQFSEKSDVYSFGVILVELLTGQHPIRTTRLEEEKSLVMYFISAMNESSLEAILDPLVLEGSTRKEVTVVANLAKQCLNPRGIERPTMKEVAMELEGLRRKAPPVQDEDDGRVSPEIQDVVSRSSTILMDNSTSTSSVEDLGTTDEQPLFNTTW